MGSCASSHGNLSQSFGEPSDQLHKRQKNPANAQTANATSHVCWKHKPCCFQGAKPAAADKRHLRIMFTRSSRSNFSAQNCRSSHVGCSRSRAGRDQQHSSYENYITTKNLTLHQRQQGRLSLRILEDLGTQTPEAKRPLQRTHLS